MDELGRFFFLKRDEAVQATFQEGVDVLELSSAVDFELLVNRVLLTGDFVYDAVESSQARNRPLYRWRGTYLQPASRARWGDKRLKMWVPWLRKREDVVTFLREFFRTYSQPSERYLVDVLCGATLPRPWEGDIRLLARTGKSWPRTGVDDPGAVRSCAAVAAGVWRGRPADVLAGVTDGRAVRGGGTGTALGVGR